MNHLQTSELEPHLRRLRRRRAALGLVGIALPFAVLAYYYAPWSSAVRTSVLLGWVAVYSFTTVRLAWSRCPRCGALYFLPRPQFRLNPFRNRCGNCECPLSSGL